MQSVINLAGVLAGVVTVLIVADKVLRPHMAFENQRSGAELFVDRGAKGTKL